MSPKRPTASAPRPCVATVFVFGRGRIRSDAGARRTMGADGSARERVGELPPQKFLASPTPSARLSGRELDDGIDSCDRTRTDKLQTAGARTADSQPGMAPLP